MTELVERIQAERLKLARAIEGNPNSPTEEALADAVAFVLCQLESAAHGADQRQAAGEPLPQDNPVDRTEEQDACFDETDADKLYCHLRPSEMRQRIFELEADLSALAVGGDVKTELAHAVYHRVGEVGLDAGRRISELEAQLAERTRDRDMTARHMLEYASERDSLRERLDESQSEISALKKECKLALSLRLAQVESENAALREQLRLWEATRDLLLSSSRAWLEEASNSQAISGGRHVLRACAEAVATALPPPVAPEPAEPPAQHDPGRPHLIGGEFQSDKYPTCPRGKVPLSVKDKTAQDLLWEYAQRRRAVDAEFAADLEEALRIAGYSPKPLTDEEREAIETKLSVGGPRGFYPKASPQTECPSCGVQTYTNGEQSHVRGCPNHDNHAPPVPVGVVDHIGSSAPAQAQVEPEQPEAWAPKVGDRVRRLGEYPYLGPAFIKREALQAGMRKAFELDDQHGVWWDPRELELVAAKPAEPSKVEAPAPDVERALKFLRQAREDADNADKLELAFRVLDDAIRLALRALDPEASPGEQLVAPLRVRS